MFKGCARLLDRIFSKLFFQLLPGQGHGIGLIVDIQYLFKIVTGCFFLSDPGGDAALLQVSDRQQMLQFQHIIVRELIEKPVGIFRVSVFQRQKCQQKIFAVLKLFPVIRVVLIWLSDNC